MSRAAHDAYLNTRVAAKSVQWLATDDLARYTGMPLAELIEVFGLGPYLQESGAERTRIRAVEQGLIQLLLADLEILIRPMHPEERGLVIAWARKFALFNLKTLLRGKIRQLDPEEIRENLYDLPDFVRLSDRDLFRTESAVELLRILEDGPLALLARQAREVYEKQQEAFALEAVIDQRYFLELARRLKRLRDPEAEQQMRQLVGSLLDQANILWLLRFRFAYGLSPSETFFQLVPSPYLLHRDRLLELVALEDQPRVIAALPDPLRGELEGAGNLMEVQRRLDRHVTSVAERVMRRGRSGVGRALAYLILRDRNQRQFFSLIQGRILRLPDDYVALALGLSPAVCVHQWQEAA